MARRTVMARVYPEDLQRLDGVRRWLQMQDGSDATMADAVQASLDNWDVTPLSVKLSAIEQRFMEPAADAGEGA